MRKILPLNDQQHRVYTIGHSTHTSDDFIQMLKSFDVTHLIDVRRFPSSRKYPHFNKCALDIALQKNDIAYTHIEALGGRRPAKKDTINIRWRNASFRGYADYMQTDEFLNAVKTLQQIATNTSTAYMCSEAVWWRCHRSMISDYLKAAGWKVLHILSERKADEHPYTSPARVSGKNVFYYDEDLLTNRI